MMSTNIRVEDKRRGIVGCADARGSGLHPGLFVCLFDLCHRRWDDTPCDFVVVVVVILEMSCRNESSTDRTAMAVV